jgi:hypothetical protein
MSVTPGSMLHLKVSTALARGGYEKGEWRLFYLLMVSVQFSVCIDDDFLFEL